MTNNYSKDEEYKSLLYKLYPDKMVSGLQTLHLSLYQEIRNYSVSIGLTIKEYIIGLGFDYIRKNQMELLLESEVIKGLDSLYPDKIIGNLKEIRDFNNILYSSIQKNAKEKKLDTYNYLLQLGYTRNNESFGQSNIIYDTVSLNKLKKEYNLNVSNLARWLGVSKQNIDNKLVRKRDVYPYWQDTKLDAVDIKNIDLMIAERITFFEDLKSNTLINIYKSKHQDNCAILIIKVREVKCIFDIPQELKDKLLEYGYNKYDSRDFEIIKDLNNNSDLISIEDTGILEIKINNKKLNTKIVSIIQTRKNTSYGLNTSKYLEFLGYKKTHISKITNEEIKDILSRYLLKNTNTVHISVTDPDYHRINTLTHRRGFSGIKEFIESFGYDYTRERITNYIQKVSEQIKENYIVTDNKIYINSFDPLYASLSQYALKNNKKMDEVLNSIGFIRLKYEELPEGFKQFDWAKYEKNQIRENYNNDTIIKLLESRAIQGNQVYISSYEPLYDRLVTYSRRHGITFDELLESYGFERVYLNNMPSESREFHWVEDTSSEAEEFIKKTLEEVEKIQGNLETSKTNREKVLRSSELASSMKKLYNYRCQLCCPTEDGFSSPLIEIEKDTYYVELHHIIPVSQKDKVDDDSKKKLDTFENVIVVCPHHHKFLHYHHDGFSCLCKDQNGKLYFKSKNSEKPLEIYTDYHLKLREDIELVIVD